MTAFADLKTAVCGTRFNNAYLPAAGRVLNARLRSVWNAEDDWTFKQSGREDLPIAPNIALQAAPAELGEPLALYDDLGYEVVQYDWPAFERDYLPQTSTVDRPWAWSWGPGGLLYVAPSASAASTFSIVYKRRVGHWESEGFFVAGPMSADTDTPPWDDAYHEVLVPGAIADLLQEENDPTWTPLEGTFQRQLDEMRDQFLPDVAGLQYNRYGYI